MKYDISKTTAPKMPNLGNGTECIKILLSQTSKDMHEPLVPMLFPILGAHISGAEFRYPDLSWKETCGMMANLVSETGGNKGQLSNLVEAICRDFRQHDKAELGLHNTCHCQKRNGVRTPAKRRIKGHETAYRGRGSPSSFVCYSFQRLIDLHQAAGDVEAAFPFAAL